MNVMLNVLCSVLSISFSVNSISAGIRKNTHARLNTTPLASTKPISSPKVYDMNISATNEAIVVIDEEEIALKLDASAVIMASSELSPFLRSCLKRWSRNML